MVLNGIGLGLPFSRSLGTNVLRRMAHTWITKMASNWTQISRFFANFQKKFLHAGEIQASKKSLEVCVTKTLLNTTTVLIPHCQVVLHWRMGHTLVRSCKASFALIFAAGRVSLIFNDAPPAVKKGQENDVLLILYLYLYLCPSLWLFQRIVSVWACHQLWQEPSSLCTRPHSKGHHMPKLMKLPDR